MSKYVVKWNCKNGHEGEDVLETMILADVAAAHRRIDACSVCGATGVGVYFREIEDAPAAEETKPDVFKASKAK